MKLEGCGREPNRQHQSNPPTNKPWAADSTTMSQSQLPPPGVAQANCNILHYGSALYSPPSFVHPHGKGDLTAALSSIGGPTCLAQRRRCGIGSCGGNVAAGRVMKAASGGGQRASRECRQRMRILQTAHQHDGPERQPPVRMMRSGRRFARALRLGSWGDLSLMYSPACRSSDQPERL